MLPWLTSPCHAWLFLYLGDTAGLVSLPCPPIREGNNNFFDDRNSWNHRLMLSPPAWAISSSEIDAEELTAITVPTLPAAPAVASSPSPCAARCSAYHIIQTNASSKVLLFFYVGTKRKNNMNSASFNDSGGGCWPKISPGVGKLLKLFRSGKIITLAPFG